MSVPISSPISKKKAKEDKDQKNVLHPYSKGLKFDFKMDPSEANKKLSFSDYEKIVASMVTTAREINQKRKYHPLCEPGTFKIQFEEDLEDFDRYRPVKGRLISKDFFPRSMPKIIESPQKGVLIFSKPGGPGGAYSDSSVLFNHEENNETWSWFQNVPYLLWSRMHKMLKEAFEEPLDGRYAFISNHIAHEAEETILQVFGILEKPAYSFEKIYKQLSERFQPTIVLTNIIIDFFGEPGEFCFDDWAYHGHLKLETQNGLLDHKKQILEKFIKMRKMLFHHFENRFYNLFSLIVLIFCF